MDYFKKNQKVLILAALWFAIVVGLFLLSEVLLPFALAILLAYVLDPLVTRINHKRIRGRMIPRFVAVLIIYGCIGVFVYLFSTLFLPELYQELVRLAKTATEALNELRETNLQEFANRIEYYLQYYHLPFQEIDLVQLLHNSLTDLSEFIKAQSSNIVFELQSLVKGVFGFFFNLILVLMIAGFILVDTGRIRIFAMGMVTGNARPAFEQFLAKVDSGLAGVVRGQLIICVVNAVLTLIGLLLLKVKFALILATLAGLFSLIPIFGSIISTVPIALVAMLTSLWTGVLALLWIAGIHFLEANFLNPKILGKTAQIHPVIVVLALVAGEHFFGIFGALLAVPIASIMLTLFESLLVKAHTYGE
ncbi:MAG: AI-2E family transporter [Myxococcota bacterium]